MRDRVDELAARLDTIAEEIADLAIDTLRNALRAGGSGRPVSEKQLTQARRAVEKAAHVWRGIDTAGPDGQ